jgi:hypothetical protein
VVFIVNQIYGPGVLAIPIVYQQAGVFPTLLALLFFFVVSSFASTMLCDAMAMIPGTMRVDWAACAYSTVIWVLAGVAHPNHNAGTVREVHISSRLRRFSSPGTIHAHLDVDDRPAHVSPSVPSVLSFFSRQRNLSASHGIFQCRRVFLWQKMEIHI